MKIAACQVPDIRENIDEALTWIERYAIEAESENVSLLCFPECFLQGYLTKDRNQARRNAIDLESGMFRQILRRLESINTVLVFGLIEREADRLFNTAVVLDKGSLLGRYRKMHLLDGEKIFNPGTSYPVFDVNGLRFGINICYETQRTRSDRRIRYCGDATNQTAPDPPVLDG